MCGIVCYVGADKANSILMEGLKRLEYRGYDSAGMAVQNGNNIREKNGRPGNWRDMRDRAYTLGYTW